MSIAHRSWWARSWLAGLIRKGAPWSGRRRYSDWQAFGRGGGNFVETIIRVGRERGQLRVVDDIAMAPTYSRDLASAILALLVAEVSPGVYHWANRGQATWHEFAAAIIEAEGIAAAVDAIASCDYPTPARRPRHSVLDTTRSQGIVGQAPHWRDGLERYIQERREITGCESQ